MVYSCLGSCCSLCRAHSPTLFGYRRLSRPDAPQPHIGHEYLRMHVARRELLCLAILPKSPRRVHGAARVLDGNSGTGLEAKFRKELHPLT
jgi:hypothetical protein